MEAESQNVSRDELYIPESNPDYITRPKDEQVARLLSRRKKVMLVGRHGCGKTEMFREYAAKNKLPYLSFSCDGSMSFREIVGHHSFNEEKGGHFFAEGLFVKYIQTRSMVILEEFGSLDAKLNFSFHQALNDGKFYSIDAQKTYDIHPECIIGMTTNEKSASYVGVRTMNTALLDRIIVLYVDDMPLSQFKSEDDELKTFLHKLKEMLDGRDASTSASIALSMRKLNHLKELLDMGFSRADAVEIAVMNQLRFINEDLYEAAKHQYTLLLGKN